MARWCCLMWTCVIAGCAGQSSRPVIPPLDLPPQAPVAAGTNHTSATIIGYSVRHRPIELYSFGSGPRPVLVMAAIHGNEPTSFDVARGLMDDLSRYPDAVAGVPVIVIPIANPDGLAANTRVSANKVDLNRNFPASNWSDRSRTRKNNYGGATSASEPETVVLMQTIERYQPRLIISVHSMDAPCNNFDGPAGMVAQIMSRYNGYPATPTIGYPTPGSLGTWAGIDRQIPMITLELPRALPASKAWPNNRQAVLAAIAYMRGGTAPTAVPIPPNKK